jgi:predicted DNA-binding transcriptional regulator AlpA
MTNEDVWLNTRDAAKYIGVSINTFKKILKLKSDFPITQFGPHLIRFNKTAIDAWMLEYSHAKMEETIEEEGQEHYE